MTDEVLTQAQAMEFLKIKSLVTLLKLVKSGKLKRTKACEKKYLYLKVDLIDFMNSYKQ